MKILDPQFGYLLMTVLSVTLLQLYKMQLPTRKLIAIIRMDQAMATENKCRQMCCTKVYSFPVPYTT